MWVVFDYDDDIAYILQAASVALQVAKTNLNSGKA